MSGIRVGVKVSGEGCPIAQESTKADTNVTEVNKASLDQEGTVVEEVVFEDDVDCSNEAFSEMFSTGEFSIYQYNRTDEANCACDHVEESLKQPISNVQIRNGSLYFTIHLDAIDDLQSMIETLDEEFETVTVCEIDHSDIKQTENTMTFNRDELTERQREVYLAAYENGYFEHNDRANASDVAAELDIAVSTFSEHISIVQKKMADAFFKNGDYY